MLSSAHDCEASQASSAVQELPKYGKIDRTALLVQPKCNRSVVSLQLMLFVMSDSNDKFPQELIYSFSVGFMDMKSDLLSDIPGRRNTLGLVSASF